MTQMAARLKREIFILIGCAFILGSLIVWNRSLWFVRGASEDSYGLWIAVIKGFEGPVSYMGNEGDYSYFRAGRYYYTRYKVKRVKVRLPETFPLGEGDPYQVTHEMVPGY